MLVNLSPKYFQRFILWNGKRANWHNKGALNLEDNRQYYYSIKPVEICNSLGVVMATLLESSISNNNSQNYKLYKTKEGNWYDIPVTNPASEKALLMSLKLAINSQQKAK